MLERIHFETDGLENDRILYPFRGQGSLLHIVFGFVRERRGSSEYKKPL